MAVQPKKVVGGGFGQFTSENRAKYMALCKGKPATAVIKMASEAWKQMSEAEQKPYQKKYDDAKQQYAKDLAAFIAAGGEVSKGEKRKRKDKDGAGKKKAKKDPDAPKKPAGGAFGCFLAANRKDFMKERPGDVTGVTKLASERWKAASEADKAKYEKEYQAKKAAYQHAMESYVPPAKEDGEEDDKPAKKSKEDKAAEKAAAKAEKEKAKEEKKADKAVKKDGRGRPKASVAKSAPEPEIPANVLAKAQKSGYTSQLTKLLQRDDIKKKNVSANDALKALEQHNGLLHAAKRSLLGEATA